MKKETMYGIEIREGEVYSLYRSSPSFCVFKICVGEDISYSIYKSLNNNGLKLALMSSKNTEQEAVDLFDKLCIGETVTINFIKNGSFKVTAPSDLMDRSNEEMIKWGDSQIDIARNLFGDKFLLDSLCDFENSSDTGICFDEVPFVSSIHSSSGEEILSTESTCKEEILNDTDRVMSKEEKIDILSTSKYTKYVGKDCQGYVMYITDHVDDLRRIADIIGVSNEFIVHSSLVGICDSCNNIEDSENIFFIDNKEICRRCRNKIKTQVSRNVSIEDDDGCLRILAETDMSEDEITTAIFDENLDELSYTFEEKINYHARKNMKVFKTISIDEKINI